MLQILLVVILVVGYHRGWNVFGQAATAALLALVMGVRIARVVHDPVYGIVGGVVVFATWCITWALRMEA